MHGGDDDEDLLSMLAPKRRQCQHEVTGQRHTVTE